jgi:hypothetical protein
MRYSWRIALALGFVGAVAVAGVSFGQDGPDDGPSEHLRRASGLHHGGPMFGLGRLVTGGWTVETEDGFLTRMVDKGEVSAVDGNVLTIERADGETVSVTVPAEARISRDRETAELSDIQPGHIAIIQQADEGDGFVVQGVHAISPAAYERLQDRIEQWSERRGDWMDRRGDLRERLRRRFQERFGGAEDGALAPRTG